MPRSSSRATKATQHVSSSNSKKRGRSPVSSTSSVESSSAIPAGAADESKNPVLQSSKRKKLATSTTHDVNNDDEDELEETDETASPITTTSSSSNTRGTIQRGVPAFLNKLYRYGLLSSLHTCILIMDLVWLMSLQRIILFAGLPMATHSLVRPHTSLTLS